MLKFLLVVFVAVCAGVGFGFMRTNWELDSIEEQFSVFRKTMDTVQPTTDFDPNQSGEAQIPKVVVVGHTTHNFGSLEKGETGEYSFIFKNEGTGPLTITLTSTSCKCTLSDLKGKKKTIVPGASYPIKLTWKSDSYAKKFRQSATVETNDPARATVTLYVEGVFVQPIRPEPANIVFSNTTPSQESESRIRLYGYKWDDVKIEKMEFMDKDSAEYFTVSSTPLTPEELKSEINSKCGFVIEVKTKKGLPLGPLRQTLKITTNKEVLDIPISGRVTGEFIINLRGGRYTFNEEKNQLQFGQLAGQTDVGADLVLSTGRKFAEEIKISLDEKDIYPSSDHIKVEILYDQFRKIGRLYQYPLRVTIPKDCPNVNLLGPEEKDLGRFIIQTTHPTEKRIEIYVRFAKTR